MENLSESNSKLENQVAQNISIKSVLKFVIPSLFGVFMFLWPVPSGGAISTPVGIISVWLASNLKGFLPIFIVYVTVFSASVCLINSIIKPKFIRNNPKINNLFSETPFFLIFRIIGALFAILIYNKIGSEVIWGADTGGTMFALGATLIAWFFAASFLMPYLMNFGIMDFTGTLVRGALRPLFTLPGRSAIDLITSWVGNCNVGVVLTREQYCSGFYTGREAAIISTCFSAVSLPFCLVIAAMLGLDKIFIPFYLSVTVTGIITVVVMARIWPLSKISNMYHPKVGKRIDEEEPEGISKFKWAIQKAVERAANADNFGGTLSKGANTFLGIIFKLSPNLIALGTIVLIVATYTPVFNWLSFPFGYYLKFLGVPEAFEAAPATIVGFGDMFIPAILAASIVSLKTRFIIGALSLVQIIYMTEVGTIILTSDIPVDFKYLFIIFIEKTILAIPILVFAANIIL